MTREYKRTWAWGEKKSVLENYQKLGHNRFLWSVIERINAGENLEAVMKDYGYVVDKDRA